MLVDFQFEIRNSVSISVQSLRLWQMKRVEMLSEAAKERDEEAITYPVYNKGAKVYNGL